MKHDRQANAPLCTGYVCALVIFSSNLFDENLMSDIWLIPWKFLMSHKKIWLCCPLNFHCRVVLTYSLYMPCTADLNVMSCNWRMRFALQARHDRQANATLWTCTCMCYSSILFDEISRLFTRAHEKFWGTMKVIYRICCPLNFPL